MADPKSQKPQVRPDPEPEDKSEDALDKELADSFPASDPPSMSGNSTAGAGPGKKSKPPVPNKE
jgi:hypothetical protein